MQALTANRLKELYTKFRQISTWDNWYKSFLAEIQYFRGLSDEEFVKPENQEKLWRARGVSGIGPGESVNVKGAYTDQEIVNHLLLFRKKDSIEDPIKRSKSLGEAYDLIMNLVHPRHSPQRPLAKQSRLFTALYPEELHTCYKWNALKHLHELVLGTKKYSFAEGGVLIRARLREVIGKEETLEENVWRAMFCWWLHEEYDVIMRGDEPGTEPIVPPVEKPEDLVETLRIWPVTKQRKGLLAIANYHYALRMIIAAARGGATPDDVVETMKDNPDFSSYNTKSCRAIFNLVRTLGFLENRDGLWHPSDEGEQLLEDDPADVLVEKLLVQIYGMAHLLKEVGDTQPAPKKNIYIFLRGLWPGWTSDFMPSALTSWLRSMGLIAVNADGHFVLTDYGNYWKRKLPKKEDIPNALSQIPLDLQVLPDEIDIEPAGDFEGLQFDIIWKVFQEDEELKCFVFEREQVETLHIAWHCNPLKRFVLLSGLSGTGKTAILSHYARIYCQKKGIKHTEHREIIAVSPDWRDPSGLLGYFNALHADPTFQAEPALRTVIAATQNPTLPYFLILDEMNLARVERYFAPFLSSMETGEHLFLHAHNDAVNGVPPRIPWPKNLFIGGTVNMDETTHPFSDKVLDRAFTLEFWNVHLDKFFAGYETSLNKECRNRIEDLLVDTNNHLFKIRRHFGYRTAGEVIDFLAKAENISGNDDPRLFRLMDQAFFSKVLPRIRGDESPVLVDVLKEIQKLCKDNNMNQCVLKLEAMQDRLRNTGVTRFWS